MASHRFQGNAVATIAVGVLVTFIASVMGQSDKTDCIVKRQNHCRPPPVTSNPNIVVEIDGQNINTVVDNAKLLNFTVGTYAIYKCKNPKPNASDDQQKWRCIKKNESNYSWETNDPNKTPNLVCDGNDLKEQVPNEEGNHFSDFIPDCKFRTGISRCGFGGFPELAPLSGSDSYLLRNLLIGICSSLGFVMIVVVIFLLHRNRTRTRPSGAILLK